MRRKKNNDKKRWNRKNVAAITALLPLVSLLHPASNVEAAFTCTSPSAARSRSNSCSNHYDRSTATHYQNHGRSVALWNSNSNSSNNDDSPNGEVENGLQQKVASTTTIPVANNNNNKNENENAQQADHDAPLTMSKSGRTTNHKKNRKNNNRFAAPLLEFGYPPAVQEYKKQQKGGKITANEKPLLLYIPGFDGTYLSAFFQYPKLHTLFEVRCLVSAMDDRSTFDEIKNRIIDFLLEETSCASPQEEEMATTTNGAPASQATATTITTTTTTTSSRPGEGILGNILRNNNNNNNNKRNGKSRPSKPQQQPRPVYLVGESFGGIMALDVALTLQQQQQQQNDDSNINLQGLTLINAATCYDRSRLAAEGPPVANMSPLLYTIGILQLLPMFLDDLSFPQFLAIIQGKALPKLIHNEMLEAYMGRLAFALPRLLKFMPQDTFDWRLKEWLQVGCQKIQERFVVQQQQQEKQQLDVPTLIVAGEKDLTLPSIAEAERLAQLLPNSKVHVVPQVGHANTAGTCLDLTAQMTNWFSALNTTATTVTVTATATASSVVVSNGEDDRGGRRPTAAPTTTTTTPPQPPQQQTSMKPVVAVQREEEEGGGDNDSTILLGMESRYDGKSIGLSPLLYWSNEYYEELEDYSPQ